MSSFEKIINGAFEGIKNSFTEEKRAEGRKNRRPLKMPKNYDFGVRNVNWNDYKNDYILRTDAVWEKSKLLDIFYVQYKSTLLYDSYSDLYKIANIRQMPLPTNDPEHFEDWRPFAGYSEVDGCIW